MNKFPIILRPVGWPVNGRTNQHSNLKQTMVFRINTMEVRNPDPSMLGYRNKRRSCMTESRKIPIGKAGGIGLCTWEIRWLVLEVRIASPLPKGPACCGKGMAKNITALNGLYYKQDMTINRDSILFLGMESLLSTIDCSALYTESWG